MKKFISILIMMFVGLACYVAGFYQGLDEKESNKQSFRTALYHAQSNLKSLQLQSQADADELWLMTQNFEHYLLLLLVGKLIKAPLFFLAVSSQANVGGAASAPVVASAFHPALTSVGVWLCGGYFGCHFDRNYPVIFGQIV